MKKLYFGGDIITMCREEDAPEAVVTEDGIIRYVGSLDEAERLCAAEEKSGKEEDGGMLSAGWRETEKIDLQGRTLMPSFIDPHSHFSQVAQGITTCDLSEAQSFEEIRDTLKTYLEERGIDENGIVFATGYDHNFLKKERHPDRHLLDQVSEAVPVYISHSSGHMGVANSALLRLAGLTAQTPDPAGGKFGREEDGSLSGYVEEVPALMKVLLPAMALMKADMKQQMDLAQEMYLKYGITTVQEGAAMVQGAQGLAQYAATGALKLDLVAYILENEYEAGMKSLAEYDRKYKDRFKIGGAKIILDGSPQGKSAWLSRPYEGESEYRGYPSHEDAYVENAVLKAVRGGYQILAHCNGDAASQQFLDSYKKAVQTVENPDMDLRPVMIHCQTVREDQLDVMKELRMIPSIFIGHTYYWGDVHLKNLGQKRGANISPVKWALERGLVYNFHQDAPVTKPDMLHSVWCAANRITRKGQPIGQEQCISVYDALKGVTINAAYEYHEEDTKGTLEAGKLADLVILDQNPLKVEKEVIKEIRVVETIKNGETCYRA